MSNGIQGRKIARSGGFFSFGISSLGGFAFVDQMEIFDRTFQEHLRGLLVAKHVFGLPNPVAEGGVVLALAAEFIKHDRASWTRMHPKQPMHQIGQRLRLELQATGTFGPRQIRLPFGKSQEGQKDIFFRTSSSSIGGGAGQTRVGDRCGIGWFRNRLTFAEEFGRDVEHFEFGAIGPLHHLGSRTSGIVHLCWRMLG